MNLKNPSVFFRCSAALLLFLSVAFALPEPREYRENSMKNPRLHRSTGEQFCWNATIALDKLLTGYEANKDSRWLDETVTYFEFLESKLLKDPDGYEGWIGRGIYADKKEGEKQDYLIDTLVGDAILLEGFVRFSEIVLSDPTLMEKFGAKAKANISFARRVGWEKWNKRGTYYRDAAGYGSYHMHDKVIDPDSWKWKPAGFSPISDNLNKHSAMGIVFLRLYRMTGEEEYRTRVVEIFSRLKNMFRYFPEDDRVSWNFWMPHGPYDVNGTRLGSWVGVHPSRSGYQATEVERMVEVFDSGLVFDSSDITRLVNANHFMMPQNNGGKWRSSDGTSSAGTLWSSLARFDPLIMKTSLEGLKGNQKSANSQISLAYLENVVSKQSANGRLLLKEDQKVSTYDFPPRPGAKLSATVVIPNQIEIANNDEAALVTQARANGALSIDLVDPKTGAVFGNVFGAKANSSGEIEIPRWDGTNPKTGKKTPGDYILRWSVDGEVRDEIVKVVLGTKREKVKLSSFPNGVAKGVPFSKESLSKGKTTGLGTGGEGADAWDLKGAEIVSKLPGGRSGKGLTVAKGQAASLIFGGEGEAFPVRITMSVYDDGEKHGTSTFNGQAWGVFADNGEFYGPALFWRKYLGTDKNHAWVSTEKSGWMSPGYARIPRKAGWHEWVFDFTESAKPSLNVDGKPAQFPAEGLPTAAAGISLRGGSGSSSLFVTDVKVEYP